MQHIFQSTKRAISICSIVLLLITGTLTIFPDTASADGFTPTSNGLTLECLTKDNKILEHTQFQDQGMFQNEDVKAIAAIAGASGATAGLGSEPYLHGLQQHMELWLFWESVQQLLLHFR